MSGPVDAVWLLVGLLVLGGTLVDVFLTALNFDESGFIAGRVSRAQWRLLRRITRRVPRRWRPVALRQVTGLQIVAVVTTWLVLIITGFGFVYYALMTDSSFSASGRGAGLTLFDAMYFSAAQLATVGGSSLTAETDLLRFLSIVESLSGVILISLILTFLLGVYSVLDDLSSLCRNFSTAERGAGSAVASLAPYFHDGQSNGLDGHLDDIADSFSSYVDGLRFHHSAYYFQSGRDQFALPYAVRMLAGTLGALRWGLPTGHPASAEPVLVPLTFQFLEFGRYLERTVPWKGAGAPEVVGREEFERMVRGSVRDLNDPWVARFVRLDAGMARLAGLPPLADLDDAHRRYSEWLPFALRAERITLAVSEDLDYQPVQVSDRPVSLLRPEDPLALDAADLSGATSLPSDPVVSSRPPGPARWRASVYRHLFRTDPGNARLRVATRTLLAALAAVASLYVVLEPLGRESLQAAVFGGFVAMLSARASVGRSQRERRRSSLLFLVPVAVLVVLGALVSDSRVLSSLLVVITATLGIWAGRFGPRWATLGRLSFMAYYFALILRIDIEDAAIYLAAAAVGVGWAYIVTHLVMPDHPTAVLRRGIVDFARTLAASLDSVLDAVSWARWDVEIRKRVELEARRLHRHTAFLGGQLVDEEVVTGLSADRATALRLRLFDTELAFVQLVLTAQEVAAATLPLEVRARLAGRLDYLQEHLGAMVAEILAEGDERGNGAAVPRLAPWTAEEPSATWERPARLLYRAIDELQATVHQLWLEAGAATRAATAPAEGAPSGAPTPAASATPEAAADAAAYAAHPPEGAPEREPGRSAALSAVTRRGLQMGTASAISLGIGWLVSATYQYWATLASFQVLGETDGETFVKGARQVAGCVAGAILGFAVVISGPEGGWVVLPLLAVAVFASTYYRPVSPGTATLWTTTIFALLYGYLGRLTDIALGLRVVETVAGALVALVVAYLVLPTHTRGALERDCATLVDDVAAIVEGAMGRLAGDPGVELAQIRERLLAADEHVRRITTTATPLRLAPGSLGETGIEGRLTAVWSLTHHARTLVRAAESAIRLGVGPAGPDWRALGQATAQNATALTEALAGRLPGPVQVGLGVYETDRDRPHDRAVAQVMRELGLVNQVLLDILDDVSPGAVSAA